MERRIAEMVAKIEGMGDPAALCDGGWFRALFQNAMERYARQIREGRVLKVGVNAHRMSDEEDTLLRDVAERKFEPCRERVAEIRDHRRSRDRQAVEDALYQMRRVTETKTDNLMPALVAALEAGATMGEITGVMRAGYGHPYDPFGMTESPV